MDYQEVKQGRVFVLRLEHGEVIHQVVERFALQENVSSAALIALGGVDAGSRLVVGPKRAEQRPIDPMQLILDQAHEALGTGTLFPDETGRPVLHMHLACGREGRTHTGCLRAGVQVWQIVEIVLFELLTDSLRRRRAESLGFSLLSRQG